MDNDLVFTREDGKPIDFRGLTRHFERVLNRAGLPKICFHDLRNTYATLSLEQSVSGRAIQETLGHHDASLTMSVYTHVTNKMKQEATDKIGNLLTSCLNE
ncbi:tyrosine-type recombinase/integrase [Candidatus Contubernalis alkalaceticus]|nr:tyrosine-type recombinase/integrase [Candidatus Contubernalis alkalaceticus]